MRSWFLYALILLLSSCSALQKGFIQATSGGKYIDHRREVSKSTYTEELQAEDDKFNLRYKDLPTTSKATILRGKSKINIDLNKPSDVAKVRDHDLIQLERGHYEKLPYFGKPVTLRGISQADTLIGKKHFLISSFVKYEFIKDVNITFEKLAMSRLRFATDYDNVKPVFTLIQVHAYGCVGSNKNNILVGYNADIMKILSKIVIIDTGTSSAFDNSKSLYTYTKYFRSSSDGSYITDKFYKVRGRSKDSLDSYTQFSSKDESEDPANFNAIANYEKDEFLTVDPIVLNSLIKDFKDVQSTLSKVKGDDYSRMKASRNQSLYEAVVRLNQGNISAPEGMSAGDQKLASVADSAAKNGHLFSASLALSLIIDSNPLSKDAPKLRERRLSYLSEIANKYGCTIKTKEDQRRAFSEVVRGIYPVLGLNAKRSKCKLEYTALIDQVYKYVSPNTVERTEYVWKETDESMRKRFAIENAQREAEKAYQMARSQKNIDEITKAGKSFARTRARFHRVGNVQYMVYGKGNLAPKEDKLLKFQEKLAKKNLERANEAASPAEYEKLKNTVTTKYIIREEKYQSELSMNLPDQNNALIKGPFVHNQSSESCRERRDHLGRVLTGMNSGNCFVNNVGNNYLLSKSYIYNEIFGHIAEPLFNFYFTDFTGTVDKLLASTDQVQKLEGNLMALALNYKKPTNESEFSNLVSAVTGQSVSTKQAISATTLVD